eukprot:1146394-Pelagomonas_calceolata.AAC.3
MCKLDMLCCVQKGCLWLWCSEDFLLAGLCAQGVRTGVLQQETKSGLWCGTLLIPVGLMLFPGWWTIGWNELPGLFRMDMLVENVSPATDQREIRAVGYQC